MARIRKLEIQNFRGVKELSWLPSAGINCLIGPGDSGKSTVLDAIDLCLGARRNLQFDDSDFNGLNVDAAISISLTIGDLDDPLKNIDTYGLFVRGFRTQSGETTDEPETGSETVLTLNLTIQSDLEPTWSLVSDRAQAQGTTRNLAWADRVRLAPTRIGALADQHLGWRRGSVLNRLATEGPDASAALLKASREARAAFGDEASDELGETLALVAETATSLGVPINGAAKALLDVESVSFGGGTISLHDSVGVPLRGLGTGSARLLIAGLQRAAAQPATIVIVDELEHGLEPHRINRLLASLGAKDAEPPLQAFVTTHSPAVLRELSGRQLFVTRAREGRHELLNPGDEDDIQSTIRLFPDAFLAPSVIVCEGASEVGFIRGLDRRRVERGETGIGALGVALVDGNGIGNVFKRAAVFQQLGYRVAVLRDDDEPPAAEVEQAFKNQGGTVFAWRAGRALEDELFLSLPDAAILGLIEQAIDLHGDNVIEGHISSRSTTGHDLNSIRMESLLDGISLDGRRILGDAATIRKAGWFKSVSRMEAAAYDHASVNLEEADEAFAAIVESIFTWCSSARR